MWHNGIFLIGATVGHANGVVAKYQDRLNGSGRVGTLAHKIMTCLQIALVGVERDLTPEQIFHIVIIESATEAVHGGSHPLLHEYLLITIPVVLLLV